MRTHTSLHPTRFHRPTSSLRTALAVVGIGALLLTACADAAPVDTGGGAAGTCEVGSTDCDDTPQGIHEGEPNGSMNMCVADEPDCADTEMAAADCETDVPCNDTGNGDPFASCEPGVACGDESTGDAPADERMNPSITIVQAFVDPATSEVTASPDEITDAFPLFLQEAEVEGATTRISFSGGSSPCFVIDRVEVQEDADQVVVTVFAGSLDNSACVEGATGPRFVTVQLDAELGSRLLLDGSRMQGADNV